MSYYKIVCAYSGGLDTSVMIPWLKENYNAEIITYTGDLGQGEDLSGIRKRPCEQVRLMLLSMIYKNDLLMSLFFLLSKRTHCMKISIHYIQLWVDPFLAQRLVEVALEHGADAIAHGCTGKGNDQVRFEVTARSLAPNMGVIAPLREWDMLTREDEIDYALERGIDIPNYKSQALFD